MRLLDYGRRALRVVCPPVAFALAIKDVVEMTNLVALMWGWLNLPL